MRLIRSAPRKCEDESTSSSIRSVDSYGGVSNPRHLTAKHQGRLADAITKYYTFHSIFGSACSDFSDCECPEDRRRYKHNSCRSYGSLGESGSPGYSVRSAMAQSESSPLLPGPMLAPAYKTITSASSDDSLGPADLSAREILATYKRTFEKSAKPERKKQSSLVTIFSVWNTIMGSSLLTMAWGVERAGLVAALVLMALMAALCLYTAHLLLRVNYYHGSDSCEVPALCRVLLGRKVEGLAHVFSLLVLLGATVVYWVLITNFLYFTVNYFMDLPSNSTSYNSSLLCPRQEPMLEPPADTPAPSPYWGLHSTVPLYVAIIVFPLMNFNNVSFFTKFNSLGTLSVVYLVVFVTVKGITWGVNMGVTSAVTWAPAGKNAAVLSGMLALSFYIHNIIITIMTNNARQDKNGRDLTIAFLLVTVTYSLVGAVFYVCFPLAKSCIEDNILNNFEMHDVMTAVARALLLFQVVTVYPLVAYMLRSEAILLLPFKSSTRLKLLVNVTIVAVCVLVACLCPRVGTIIRYTGAVSGLVHVFALPTLLHARSLQLRGELTTWKTFFYCCIVVFGAVNLLMQFFIE